MAELIGRPGGFSGYSGVRGSLVMARLITTLDLSTKVLRNQVMTIQVRASLSFTVVIVVSHHLLSILIKRIPKAVLIR